LKRKHLTCTSEIIPMHKHSLLLFLSYLLVTACDTQPTNTYRPAPAIGGEQQAESDVQMLLPEQPNTTTAPASNTALNPEHGQPGHRCDLAVGAPLNGSPAPNKEISTQLNTAQPQPSATIQPQPATPAAAGNETLGSKKLNPEHGQPGHDCAVQVGSPLP
jgi:hypothetical protein